MGKIAVHEFITLDGVIEDPSWTVGYPFDPKMGEAIGSIIGPARGCCRLDRLTVGWVCQAVRAPGVKWTLLALRRRSRFS